MAHPKGYIYSKETIEKIRKSNLGKHFFKHTFEAKEKIKEASKKLWEQKWYREKMMEVSKKPNSGQFGQGITPWNKGLKLSNSNKKTRWSKTIRRKVIKDKCVYCGSKEKLELDHIVALCNGGSNT